MTCRFYKDDKFLIGFLFVVMVMIDPFGNVTINHMTKEGMEDIITVDYNDYDVMKYVKT